MMNKKQQYQAAIREKVKEGLINKPNGEWARPSSQDNNMFRSQAFGYKLGRLLGLPLKKRKIIMLKFGKRTAKSDFYCISCGQRTVVIIGGDDYYVGIPGKCTECGAYMQGLPIEEHEIEWDVE